MMVWLRAEKTASATMRSFTVNVGCLMLLALHHVACTDEPVWRKHDSGLPWPRGHNPPLQSRQDPDSHPSKIRHLSSTHNNHVLSHTQRSQTVMFQYFKVLGDKARQDYSAPRLIKFTRNSAIIDDNNPDLQGLPTEVLPRANNARVTHARARLLSNPFVVAHRNSRHNINNKRFRQKVRRRSSSILTSQTAVVKSVKDPFKEHYNYGPVHSNSKNIHSSERDAKIRHKRSAEQQNRQMSRNKQKADLQGIDTTGKYVYYVSQHITTTGSHGLVNATTESVYGQPDNADQQSPAANNQSPGASLTKSTQRSNSLTSSKLIHSRSKSTQSTRESERHTKQYEAAGPSTSSIILPWLVRVGHQVATDPQPAKTQPPETSTPKTFKNTPFLVQLVPDQASTVSKGTKPSETINTEGSMDFDKSPTTQSVLINNHTHSIRPETNVSLPASPNPTPYQHSASAATVDVIHPSHHDANMDVDVTHDFINNQADVTMQPTQAEDKTLNHKGNQTFTKSTTAQSQTSIDNDKLFPEAENLMTTKSIIPNTTQVETDAPTTTTKTPVVTTPLTFTVTILPSSPPPTPVSTNPSHTTADYDAADPRTTDEGTLPSSEDAVETTDADNLAEIDTTESATDVTTSAVTETEEMVSRKPIIKITSSTATPTEQTMSSTTSSSSSSSTTVRSSSTESSRLSSEGVVVPATTASSAQVFTIRIPQSLPETSSSSPQTPTTSTTTKSPTSTTMIARSHTFNTTMPAYPGLSVGAKTGIAAGCIVAFWIILGPIVCVICCVKDKAKQRQNTERRDSMSHALVEEMIYRELARGREKMYQTSLNNDEEITKLNRNGGQYTDSVV